MEISLKTLEFLRLYLVDVDTLLYSEAWMLWGSLILVGGHEHTIVEQPCLPLSALPTDEVRLIDQTDLGKNTSVGSQASDEFEWFLDIFSL